MATGPTYFLLTLGAPTIVASSCPNDVVAPETVPPTFVAVPVGAPHEVVAATPCPPDLRLQRPCPRRFVASPSCPTMLSPQRLRRHRCPRRFFPPHRAHTCCAVASVPQTILCPRPRCPNNVVAVGGPRHGVAVVGFPRRCCRPRPGPIRFVATSSSRRPMLCRASRRSRSLPDRRLSTFFAQMTRCSTALDRYADRVEPSHLAASLPPRAIEEAAPCVMGLRPA